MTRAPSPSPLLHQARVSVALLTDQQPIETDSKSRCLRRALEQSVALPNSMWKTLVAASISLVTSASSARTRDRLISAGRKVTDIYMSLCQHSEDASRSDGLVSVLVYLQNMKTAMRQRRYLSQRGAGWRRLATYLTQADGCGLDGAVEKHTRSLLRP